MERAEEARWSAPEAPYEQRAAAGVVPVSIEVAPAQAVGSVGVVGKTLCSNGDVANGPAALFAPAQSGIKTFHWHDWTLESLLEARRGTSVSLVVPARNEAATVGDVVSRVREALMDTVSLIDEVVVIDSDSTDSTYSVASDAGAVVHRSSEIRPDLGTYPGKGEAMWKSLFVTSGDLVVFMDADLLDWDTHFVPGILGPLLYDPNVALVKGFYDVLVRKERTKEVESPNSSHAP